MKSEKDKKQKVFPQIKDTIDYIDTKLAVEKSFDVIKLDLNYADRQMAMYMVDGFAKDDILLFIMKWLSDLQAEDIEDHTLDKLLKKYIPYVEVETSDDLEGVMDSVLAGPIALVVEGIDKVILIDARTYPVRGPQEPDMEKVVRGSRDGFVETLVFNTALIRRRVRDRSLRMVYMQIGRRSKTDIVICYNEEIADPSLVEAVKKSLEAVDTDGLPLGEKTLEEFISGRYWNPFPMVRYTERPDTAAAHLFEGHICIIVDGSPSIMMTPTTFWHHLQHAEEYRNKPLVGAYLRMARFAAVFASIFLLPIWYLMSVRPNLLPAGLTFIGPEEIGPVPLIVQFILIEIGLDVLRMAAIHTPSSLATALGLVAALMIGQVAVEVGILINEVILYFSIAAIGTFATPSYEMSLATRLIRLALLVVTAMFHEIGFIIATTLLVVWLSSLRSFSIPYFWPFIPFNARAFFDVFVRSPIPLKNRRPKFLHPKDPDR